MSETNAFEGESNRVAGKRTGGQGRGGRRPGNPGTREDILAAARSAFADAGFDATTVRDIARAAGVDAALIHHYFGTKEQLFLEVVDFPIDPDRFAEQVLVGPQDELGRRLLATLLQVWESPLGASFVALVRTSVQHDWSAAILRQFLLTRVLGPVMRRVEDDEQMARWRAGLLATQVAGLAMSRYVLKFESLVTASHEEIVAAVAPTLQRYINGEVPRSNGGSTGMLA